MLPTAFHTARCKPPRSWLRREAWTPSAPKLWEKGYRHRGTEFVLQVLLPGFFQFWFLPSIALFCFPCLPLSWLLLTYDSYCYNAMMYCSFVDFALYAFRDIQFTCRVNQQVKEGQQLEGCKTRLYVAPVAFEMYEGIFHNDGPLDWNPGGCTHHRMYASPSDTWRLTSVGGIHWPPRWVLKCFKYAAAISPMLNGFCSPCGSDFQSVSVCIAMNKPCVPKTSDYLIFGLFAQWLLVWTEKDWKFSLWTWPLLLLSAIVLQIWGRRSTTLFYGIGLFWTLFNPQCCHRRLRSAGK